MNARRMLAPIETKLLGMILVTPIVLAAVAMLWAPILIVLSIYLVGMVLHKVGTLGAGAGNVSTMAEELLTGLEGRYREVLLADRIPIPASGSFTIGITQTDGGLSDELPERSCLVRTPRRPPIPAPVQAGRCCYLVRA